MRTKHSYMLLVHQILRLLTMERRLQQKLAKLEKECEGMRLSGHDVTKCEAELQLIYATLVIIGQTHGDLIGLLRERMMLKQELHHRPEGYAGQYHRVLASARLSSTKKEIGKIISMELSARLF